MNIQLKAKHFYYIAQQVKGKPTSEYFSLILNIKSASNGVQDNDLLSVATTPNQVGAIYDMLTMNPEGQAAVINEEMYQLLSAQIQTNMSQQSPDPEWVSLYNIISDIRTMNLGVADRIIDAGKQFIKA